MTVEFKVGDLVLLKFKWLLNGHENDCGMHRPEVVAHGYGIVKQICGFRQHGWDKSLQVLWFGNGTGMLPLKSPGQSFFERYHVHATDEAIIEFDKQKKEWLMSQKS